MICRPALVQHSEWRKKKLEKWHLYSAEKRNFCSHSLSVYIVLLNKLVIEQRWVYDLNRISFIQLMWTRTSILEAINIFVLNFQLICDVAWLQDSTHSFAMHHLSSHRIQLQFYTELFTHDFLYVRECFHYFLIQDSLWNCYKTMQSYIFSLNSSKNAKLELIIEWKLLINIRAVLLCNIQFGFTSYIPHNLLIRL